MGGGALMTTQARIFKAGVEMNGVHCPRCGAECFNTGGLIEHLKHCKGNAVDDEIPWEVADEIECKPGLWFDEPGILAWWPEDQTDEDQGSTDDDPEPEEGSDDDSLDFDVFLATARVTSSRRELTQAEQQDFNYGWDSFFFGRIPANINRIQRAGHEAARKQFEDDISAERELFAQTIDR